MPHSVNGSAVLSQANSNGLRETDEDKELVLLREDLKAAIEESGEKKEYIAAAMGLTDPTYLSKLFSGEKPISARHIVGLPNKVETIYERKRAERRGLIVVEPLTGLAAQKALVAGLIGVMSAPAIELPAKSSGQMKADLTERRDKKTA